MKKILFRMLIDSFILIFYSVYVFGAESLEGNVSNPVRWMFRTSGSIWSTPVVTDSVIYFGSRDSIFYAVDLKYGRELWHYKTPFPINSKAAVSDQMVLFESGFRLYALNKITGHLLWSYVANHSVPEISIGFTDYHHSSPLVSNHVAYYGDGWGNINGINTDKGTLVFQFTIHNDSINAIRSTPVIYDNKIYFGDWLGHVYAVSLTSGSLVWKYTNQDVRTYYGAVVSDMVIKDSVLYYGSQHDVFAPLNIATGKPVWTYKEELHTYLPSTPVFYDSSVIIGTTIFRLSVLSLHRGKVQWAFNADGIFFTTPIIRDSVLIINSSYFGSHGTLYFIDCKDGHYINGFEIPKASPTSPVLSGNTLLIGDGNGVLYALDYHKVLDYNLLQTILLKQPE
jgi:outer membrane protein assembly factor BamB